MTFSDIFKSSFLENITSVSPLDMVLAMVLAFALGVFIFLIYKKTYSGVMYSSSFGVTLVALTMITTFVILAVTSNVVLSLGMVGALSIVRFRTAIKEPLDIAFLFWSIAVGIVLAAGMIPLAVFGSLIIGIILLIFVNRNGNMDILFERFYRLDSSRNSKTGGSGIGLSIVKSIVDAHKGSINAKAIKGESIEFEITFKAAQ